LARGLALAGEETDSAAVPESVQQTIARQIERRGTTARQVLEAASVAGMEFAVTAVAAGLQLAPDVVAATCEELVREGHFLPDAGVVEWPDGTVSGAFAFRHTLYQQVLYERIPAWRRVQLHRRVGRCEEAAHGERASEIAAKLAAHFARGLDLERAVSYLARAAENAIRRSAYHEAIRQLGDGLDLLQRQPDSEDRREQELAMQALLAHAVMVAHGVKGPHVRPPCERALELCSTVRETPRLVSIMAGLRAVSLARGDIRTAIDLAERTLAVAQRFPEPL